MWHVQPLYLHRVGLVMINTKDFLSETQNTAMHVRLPEPWNLSKSRRQRAVIASDVGVEALKTGLMRVSQHYYMSADGIDTVCPVPSSKT